MTPKIRQQLNLRLAKLVGRLEELYDADPDKVGVDDEIMAGIITQVLIADSLNSIMGELQKIARNTHGP